MNQVRVQKSILIGERAGKVFDFVRDFGNWHKWSPWLIADPDCKVSCEKSVFKWESEIIGTGSMEVISEEKPHSIKYRLCFLKPWKSEAEVNFIFEKVESDDSKDSNEDHDSENENDESEFDDSEFDDDHDDHNDLSDDSKKFETKIIWAMNTSLPFFLFWMKKMITALTGMDYERGLRMLKPVIEKGHHPSRLEFVGETHQPSCEYVGMLQEGKFDEIGKISECFKKLMEWLSEKEIMPMGSPFSIDHRSDLAGGMFRISACIPIESVPEDLPESFSKGIRPEMRTYAIRHIGPYDFLGNAWAAGMFRSRAKVFSQNKNAECFEVYENDPSKTDAEKLITIVHFPLK